MRKKKEATKPVTLRMTKAERATLGKLARLERRTYANMLAVIFQRYLACPHCQSKYPTKEKP